MSGPKEPIALNARGLVVKELHRQLVKLGRRIPKFELIEAIFGSGTQAALLELQESLELPKTGVLDEPTRGAIEHALPQCKPPSHRVQGRIVSDRGAPAADLPLRIYDRGFAGAVVELAECRTQADGSYDIPYYPHDAVTNLEVRAVGPDGAEIVLSSVTYAAGPNEVLNLIVPTSLTKLADEYTRMRHDLAESLGNAPLAAAVETDERQDITLLHQATGWDARLISLAVSASTAATTSKIPEIGLYALFRAGLPSDLDRLARVGEATVARALERVDEAGIVSLGREQQAGIRAAYSRFARSRRRQDQAIGALSTVGELLASSGLDERERETFEQLVVTKQQRGAELWASAAQMLPLAKVTGLQLQGKLAYLTLNNAPLAASLQAELESPDKLSTLVDSGLYAKSAWTTRLRDLAGEGAELDAVIPPAYAGSTAERLDAYAEDLARKVRLTYPTQTLVRMVANDELRLGQQHATVKQPVVAFMTRATSLGFELGETPIDVFVREHHEQIFADWGRDGVDAAVGEVKTMQRLYQITPTNEAMQVLYDAKIRSAYDVLSMSRLEFLDRFGDLFGSTQTADLVYRKSEQVASVVYNFFTAAKQLDTAPSVYVLSPPSAQREAAKNELIKHFPTMEELFGSLDFCECDHCRSVLSPAAYLVDLLKFLDPDDVQWQHFLQAWRSRHGGAAYTDTHAMPYDALVERRPDIAYLPLTCENTNTALPYIDLVNEILEYFVAHSQIDPAAARDTGAAETADLLAEPQHVEVAAYDTLAQAKYPLGLPFDLWLETVRGFLHQFETPLAQVLEVFRPTDELQSAGPPTEAYARASVFVEALGLSPAELNLLTDPAQLAAWPELFGYNDESAALSALASAKTLSRRLGVSYREVVELVKTSFVNPGLTAESTVSIALVLHDTTTACDFSATTLGYADGTAADALVFVRLNVFVRLWRKLGWTIEELDRALAVFIPKNSLPLTLTSIGPALQTALVYFAHLDALAQRLSPGRDARMQLLGFWSDIPTRGQAPLYARLFLTPSVLQSDPAFDDPLGDYLSTPGVLLADHLPALQGALNLSADEIRRILEARGQALATVELTLAHVSMLHRHAVLSKALKLSVRELLALVSLAGLDPFMPIHADVLDSIANDHPFAHTLRFVEIVERVRASGFSVDELRYLLAHQFDSVGPFRDDRNQTLTLVKALAQELRRIANVHALPPDDALADELIQQRLALALPAEAADRFWSMISGDVRYEARISVAETDALDPSLIAGNPALQLSYDPVRGEQRLVHTGVLTDAERATLVSGSPQVFASLLADVYGQGKSFFENYRPGILESTDFETLFAPTADRAARRRLIAPRLFGFVRTKLSQQAIVQIVAAQLDADPVLVGTLLTDASLLDDPSSPGQPLVTALISTGAPGVSASYWTTAAPAGAPASTALRVTVSTRGRPGDSESARFEGYLEVPVAGAYRFFVTLSRPGMVAELRLADLPNPVLSGTATAADVELSGFVELKPGIPHAFRFEVGNLGDDEAELLIQGESVAKQSLDQLLLYPAATISACERARLLLGSALRLMTGLGFSEREARHLLREHDAYAGLALRSLPTSVTSLMAAQARFARFLRVVDYARLKRALGLGNDDLVIAMEHARLEHPAGTELTTAAAELLDSLAQRFSELTRRELGTISGIFDALQIRASASVEAGIVVARAPLLGDERGLWRIWDALTIVESWGVSVSEVVGWTAIISPTTTTAAAGLARRLRDSIKARYQDAAWRRIAQPIFDKLRRKQRDALVAHIMHTRGFERIEQLFEFFLIDPGMEPVVQTSRIQLAIASVQLFIQRCLLNLEPKVHPSAINARHWQWMRRYRLWEANRKIFLFPENWLEPEFRDDKSFLFEELEGALLQGDVSTELAEDAFFRYLQQLELLARLEIVGLYAEEDAHDPGSNVLHVIGRTFNQPPKYFYRRLAHRVWTAWDPVTVDIEGDHIVPVMWRGRLHLFWVTFLVRAKQESTTSSFRTHAEQSIANAAVRECQVQLHWTELYQDEWKPRQSSDFTAPATVPADFDPKRVYVHVSKEFVDGTERAVQVHVATPIDRRFRLRSKNSRPETDQSAEALPAPPYSRDSSNPVAATRYLASGPLEVTFTEKLVIEDGKAPVAAPHTAKILAQGDRYSLLFSANRLQAVDPEFAPLINPFFYQDSEHTFYVEPTLKNTTIETWEEWVITTPGPDTGRPELWENVPIIPEFPRREPWPPLGPGDPWFERDPRAIYPILTERDWVSDPATVFEVGDRYIGRTGSVALQLQPLERSGVAGQPVAVAAGSELEAGKVLLAPNQLAPSARPAGALNVIGGGGLNDALLQQINGLNQ